MNPWQQPDPNAGPPQPGPPRPGPPHQPYPAQFPPQQSYPAQQQQYPYPQYPQYPGPQHHQQYPGQPQQYPQYPGYPPYPAPPASSGTAVTAIVLSFVVALLQGFAVIGYLAVASELADSGTAIEGWVPTFLAVMGIARLVVAVALVVGAVLLIRRSTTGRSVAAGAALAMVLLQLVEYGVRASVLPTSGANPFSTLSSVILPIVLLVVVLNGSTRRWIDSGPTRRREDPLSRR